MESEPMKALQAQCAQCSRCPLGADRTHLVFGDGNCHAPLMLVGEGPGEQEDLQGVPFVGPAGKLLDQMMAILDLDRSSYYICNIVKCRPPGNRDPAPAEQEACAGWLQAQIELVQPKIIFCLGRIAAQRLIDPGFRITRQHGQWVQRHGIWYAATFHPSALLRDVKRRPDAFDDLMSLREKLAEVEGTEMPEA